MIQLKGKTALVTGAGSGIGRAIAVNLARRGCNLVLVGRRAAALDVTASMCPGVNTLVAPADIAVESSIGNLYKTVAESGFKIDIFVLNAGISQREKVFDTGMDVVRKIMEVDFFGPISVIKHFEPQIMVAEHIQIAVTSSISGLFGFPLRSSYSAAKHALVGFFESLDLEYPNVDVTLLFPGRINTDISLSALHGDGSAYGLKDPGQANGMDADRCGRIAVEAIRRQKHRKLIGGGELLMVYIHKWFFPLYYKLARKISAV